MRYSFERILLIVVFFTSIATAAIIHVPQDQPTIQAEIDISVDGDTVLVQAGTYVENINFNDDNPAESRQIIQLAKRRNP